MSATWRTVGPVAYGIGASLSALHLALYQDRPWALLALLAAPLALRWPLALIGGSLLLMVGYIDTGYADQTDLGRAAAAALLAGESPWQIHDLGTHTNPFAYGPLAMLTAQLGPRLEIVSALGLLAVLYRAGAVVTMSLIAGLPIFVMLTLTGINDYTPALLIVSGLLLLRNHPRAGGLLLGVAAALKPYAAAWFLLSPWPWIASAVLWAPMLPFAGDFLAMTRVAAGYAGFTPLRLLAVPFGVASLVARQWRTKVLLGAGIFAAVMLFGDWASLGYWIVVIPVAGMALEPTSAPASQG